MSQTPGDYSNFPDMMQNVIDGLEGGFSFEDLATQIADLQGQVNALETIVSGGGGASSPSSIESSYVVSGSSDSGNLYISFPNEGILDRVAASRAGVVTALLVTHYSTMQEVRSYRFAASANGVIMAVNIKVYSGDRFLVQGLLTARQEIELKAKERNLSDIDTYMLEGMNNLLEQTGTAPKFPEVEILDSIKNVSRESIATGSLNASFYVKTS